MKKLIFALITLMTASTAMAEEVATSTDIGGLLGKGLIVTAGGLCGVFLVLILFFLTIKVMQKVLK
ncbi:MAG: hypothetical protein IJ507_05355 [Clostridia bacterium]|nr:hypothetical protein [Clostridia bacterium]